MWRHRTLADVARGLRDTAARPGAYPHRQGAKVHARGTNTNKEGFSSDNKTKNNSNNNGKRSWLWFYPSSWGPSTAFVWLKANAMALAAYQLFLEASCTAFFAWTFLRGRLTVSDTEALLRKSNGCTALLADLVDWESGQHAEGYTIAGHHIDAGTLTAIHTGHNIAAGMLPLQLLLLALTYPAVRGVWLRAKEPLTASMRYVRERGEASVFGNRFAGHTTPATAAENTATRHPFGKRQRHYK